MCSPQPVEINLYVYVEFFYKNYFLNSHANHLFTPHFIGSTGNSIFKKFSIANCRFGSGAIGMKVIRVLLYIPLKRLHPFREYDGGRCRNSM